MTGKVWIVKLNPSGGLLRSQKKRIKDYGLSIGKGDKYDFNKEDLKNFKKQRIADYCRDRNPKIIAIGWTVNPEDSWKVNSQIELTKEEYLELFNKLYKNQRWKNEVTDFQKINKGDFCWVRDSSDKYYICQIKSDWKYDMSKESWALNIAQRYENSEWIEVGDASKVPGEIVKRLITRGPTVYKINKDESEKNTKKEEEMKSEEENLAEMTEYLFKNGGGNAIDNVIKEYDSKRESYLQEINVDDLTKNLTEYDYEDLVGFYLQSQGWFIMPSTRYQSTKDYEFVAINKESEKAVVQVKHQEKKLRAKDYEELSKTYKVFLACSSGVDGIDKNNNNIEEISSEKLLEFLNQNNKLIPDRIKFSIIFNKIRTSNAKTN